MELNVSGFMFSIAIVLTASHLWGFWGVIGSLVILGAINMKQV